MKGDACRVRRGFEVKYCPKMMVFREKNSCIFQIVLAKLDVSW